nr:hypothetical protein [Flavobacterium sp. ASV13]
MTNIGEFSGDGYGMSIILTDLFTEYLKEKKCRAKKLLSYFAPPSQSPEIGRQYNSQQATESRI